MKGKIRNLVAGIYEFELRVTDNVGLWGMDTVQVLVDDPSINQPPVANAGPDQMISWPRNSVILNGGASIDPDNNIIAYEWTTVSGPSAFNFVSDISIVTEVNDLVQGNYSFELKVTDADSLFSRDTVQIVVTPPNLLPIARAGNDTVVQSDEDACTVFPVTLTLNASNSYDPDGTIVSYRWTGPGTLLQNNNAPVATVKNLVPGLNRFILKVTDNYGGAGYDTMYITINAAVRQIVTAQLISIGQLSESRTAIAMMGAGSKVIFAGGWPTNQTSPASSRVDIYDIHTRVWTTAQLPEGRFSIGTARHGTKIFLAGGGVLVANGGGGYEYPSNSSSARVDIFDVATNTWTSSQLSSKRSPTGASAGNKVVFAGGDDQSPSTRVDIYDVFMGSWTTDELRSARHISQAAVLGYKIYFGGGSSGYFYGGWIFDDLDVYDAASNSWSRESLNVPRGFIGSIGADGKVYWGGGYVNDGDAANYVEVRDESNNTTSFQCLSEGRGMTTAVRKDDQLIFYSGTFSGNKFDIYDLTTGTWSIGVLPANVVSAGRIMEFGNELYVTKVYMNGDFTKEVYKLVF